jgi:GDP/UDP-N,N'-diacetylbacillosamine 2-epimerase (hydrolysing)
MKIGVLTSSRADYGIYLPLLNKLIEDQFFNLEIIAFGTHLSKSHGFTVEEIEKSKFSNIHKISTLLSNDDECSIATSYGLTVIKFADFWSKNKFDLVFCLGDRFEMSAAVQAGIPFGIKYAHIHGGETTLGAIDNIYRHQITLASLIHFTATKQFTSKVMELIGENKYIYNFGALSLDGIEKFKPIEKKLFLSKFNLPHREFALVTFHPETISPELNQLNAREMRLALEKISKTLFLIITMPNADTMGSIFRSELIILQNNSQNEVLCIENFGKENYFSAMAYAKLLIGNTSSGIIEAASFGKYVLNVGNRQSGRLQNGNLINVPFEQSSIINEFINILKLGNYNGDNIYHQHNTASNIINVIKNYNESI